MLRVVFFTIGFVALTASTEASPFVLSFEFDAGGYVGIEAGTGPGSVIEGGEPWGRIYAPTGTYEYRDLFESLVVEVRSGPLSKMTLVPPVGPNEFPATIYEYDVGAVFLEATWRENGSLRSGAFTAPIPDFTLTVRDEGIVDDCSDVCVHTQDTLTIGRGRFDRSLARYLGVSRRSRPSEMNWYLELIDGSPGDDFRVGNFNPSGLSIHAEVPRGRARLRDGSVPEPGISLLALLGTAAVVLRQRHRQSSLTSPKQTSRRL